MSTKSVHDRVLIIRHQTRHLLTWNVDAAVKTIAEKWQAYLATTLVAEKRLVEECFPTVPWDEM